MASDSEKPECQTIRCSRQQQKWGQFMDIGAVRQILAPQGVMRVAMNTGNRALVQQEGEALHGVAPALARRFVQELGVKAEIQRYPGAGATVKAADGWDLGFLAIDDARRHAVTYTRAYVVIEGAVAVRRGGPITSVEQLDQPGNRILVATGAAYDLALTRSLKHAELEREPNPTASFEKFLQGAADAVAGVRQSLERHFTPYPDIEILPEAVMEVHQAMALPLRHAAALPFVEAFLDRARADGFVRRALDASGQTGLKVPA